MLIGLINKSLAIYGHYAPPALQLKKWGAGETVWEWFTRVGRRCLKLSCKEVKVAWANCRRYSREVLQQSVNGLFTAFTNRNGRSACFCQWCTQLLSVTTRFSGVQATFQNHDFYFISVFQVFCFDVDELSPLLIITLQRNSALYMYAKCIFH